MTSSLLKGADVYIRDVIELQRSVAYANGKQLTPIDHSLPHIKNFLAL
jgi:hypothetical protein